LASLKENQQFVLRKMLQGRNIGGKHTDIENIPKGKPTSEHGEIAQAINELMKYGWILPKKVPYGSGTHVSINPRALAQIRAFLRLTSGS
jgi:hypothetical protein